MTAEKGILCPEIFHTWFIFLPMPIAFPAKKR